MAWNATARWAIVLLACSVVAACGGSGSADIASTQRQLALSAAPGGLATQAPDQACAAIATRGTDARPDSIRAACVPPAVPTWSDRVAVGFKSSTLLWNPVEGAERYEVFEDADGPGSSPELLAAETTGTEYAVTLTRLVYEYANTRVRVRACNAAGCSPFTEARGLPLWADPLGPEWDVQGFGRTVTMSADGATLAVASRQAGSGMVQVYTRPSGGWSRQATLKPLSRISADFGAALALSADGNTLVVGSPTDHWGAPDVGGAEVYVRNGETWTHQGALRPASATAQGRFGASVAMGADGNTLAVGAPGHDGLAPGAGAAFIYKRIDGTWTLDAGVRPVVVVEAGDGFGSAVALSGDGRTLAVGAPGEDGSTAGINGNRLDNSATDSGAAYVFTRDADTWREQAYVKPSNPLVAGAFGAALALTQDGGMLAVGAPQERSAATGVNGNQNDMSAPGAGAVYLLVRTGTAWAQTAYVKADNTGAGDQFGASVALAEGGHRLAVGALREDGAGSFIGGLDGVLYGTDGNLAPDSGAVYTFDRDLTNSWRPRGYLKPYASWFSGGSSAPPVAFGRSVSFGAYGNLLAAGAEGSGSGSVETGLVLTY